MGEYIVAGLRTNINNRVYERGDKVELSDKEALYLLSLGIVISAVSTKLPTDSDGLFGELQIKVAALEKQVEQQKTMIANFTKELELKNARIAELEATATPKKK